MLRKSSKCEKGKRLCNSEFSGENDSTSYIRVLSTCCVSNFNIISFKNALKTAFYFQNPHRDIMLQSFTCLYEDRKPVFCYIRLASIDSLETSSVNSILNFINNNEIIEITCVSERSELNVSKTKIKTVHTILITPLKVGSINSAGPVVEIDQKHYIILLTAPRGPYECCINLKVKAMSNHIYYKLLLHARIPPRWSFGVLGVVGSVEETVEVIEATDSKETATMLGATLGAIVTGTSKETTDLTLMDGLLQEVERDQSYSNSNPDHHLKTLSRIVKIETSNLKREEEYSSSHLIPILNQSINLISLSSFTCQYFNNHVSVSIAKAHLCLSNPSIITSIHCRTFSHSSLWLSCLSFKTPGYQILSCIIK